MTFFGKPKRVIKQEPHRPSVLNEVLKGQLTGKSCKSLRKLPPAVYQRLQTSTNGMVQLLTDLERHLGANELEACKRSLGAIHRQVSENTSTSHHSNKEAFVLLGGETILIRVLSSSFAPPKNRSFSVGGRSGQGGMRRSIAGRFRMGDAGVPVREEAGLPSALQLMQNEGLAIFRELCFSTPFFSESLAVQKDFLIRLFALMESTTTFDHAVGLAEEILAVREETLSLQDVPNFPKLVCGLSSRQLAYFCRVLAMVVFEPEDRSPEFSIAQKGLSGSWDPSTRAEKEQDWAVADGNHDVILEIPEILPRLVKLLQVKGLPFSNQFEAFQEHAAGHLHNNGGEWQPLLGPHLASDHAYWEDLDEDMATEDEEDAAAAALAGTTLGMLGLDSGGNSESGRVPGDLLWGWGAGLRTGEGSGTGTNSSLLLTQNTERNRLRGSGHGAMEVDYPSGIPVPSWLEGEPGPPEAFGSGFSLEDGVETPSESRSETRSLMFMNTSEGSDPTPMVLPSRISDTQESEAVLMLTQWSRDLDSGDPGGEGPSNWQDRQLLEDPNAHRSNQSGRQRNNSRLGADFREEENRPAATPTATTNSNFWQGFWRWGESSQRGDRRTGTDEGDGLSTPVNPSGTLSVRRDLGGGSWRGSERLVASDATLQSDAPGFLQETGRGESSGSLGGQGTRTGLSGSTTTSNNVSRTNPPQRQPGWGGLGLFGNRNTSVGTMDLDLEQLVPERGEEGNGGRDGAVGARPDAENGQANPQTQVMVIVGNAPRLLEEVPEGTLRPLWAAFSQEAGGDAGGFMGLGPNFMERAGLTLASHQVEVLFVLCALCGGKRKERVQDRLAELGLVRTLARMFDRLDWSAPQPIASEPHGIHGPGCACNPQSALKIQYLRLVHNFCDRDCSNFLNKQLLAAPEGLHGDFPRSSSWQTASSAPRSLLRAEGSVGEGLMLKILKVLMGEPADSVYRFWLASCVEAFLRGSDPRDQEFVASAGLMEHLVEEILKGGFKCASALQINFDLLGELIKFSPTMLSRLNGLLTNDKFERFIHVLLSHLVDSNVFIRSVVLSLESFRTGSPTPSFAGPSPSPRSSLDFGLMPSGPLSPSPRSLNNPGSGYGGYMSSYSRYTAGWGRGLEEFDEGSCKLTAFMTCNSVRLLRDLMSAVRLGDINQDNICVLNTALIFFIFAERGNQLAQYLHALRTLDATLSSQTPGDLFPNSSPPGSPNKDSQGPGSVVRNFRALLDFWREYYLRKRGRDIASLQYSTNVPFPEWRRIVDLLCGGAEYSTSLLFSPQATASQCAALSASMEAPSRRS